MAETGARRVLIVDDENLLQWGLVTRFRKAGYDCEGCDTAEDALRHMGERPSELVILDLRLPGMDGMECLQILKERYPDTSVVMMTGHGAIESAVEAMRLGAYNYLTKPFDFRSMLSMAGSILGPANDDSPAPASPEGAPDTVPRAPTRGARGTRAGYGVADLIGSSHAIQQIRALLTKVARSSANTVLLTGESGTGKDLAAEIIHYESSRRAAPFIHVNVAAVPPALFESELFGHEKGSFTDARVSKEGLLELAEGGTIYLDEITELSREIQAKLLLWLEHREFRRVGGVVSRTADVRVVAATNADLKTRIMQGTFRDDLYFRLRVIPIHLPPLARRSDDVLELAEHFLRRFNTSFGKSFEGFSPEAKRKLRSHHWPGNVRELRNALERTVTLEDGTVVGPEMLQFEEVDRPPPADDASVPALASGTGGLKELERKMVVSALEQTNWNQLRAAEILGIGRDALRYRMRKHGLL